VGKRFRRLLLFLRARYEDEETLDAADQSTAEKQRGSTRSLPTANDISVNATFVDAAEFPVRRMAHANEATSQMRERPRNSEYARLIAGLIF